MAPLRSLLRFSTVLALSSSLAKAATITWTVQGLTGDPLSDVRNDGSTVFAYNLGSNSPVATVTLNGVLFTRIGATGIGGFGEIFDIHNNNNETATRVDFQNSAENLFASTGGTGDWDALPADYKNLLSTGVDANAEANVYRYFTISGLEEGQEYVLQFFVNDSRSQGNNRSQRFTSWETPVGSTTGGVLLNRRNQDGAGSLGYSVTGTFTADSETQGFRINGSNWFPLNAVQLRAIPEPSIALSASLGLMVLLRRKRPA